MKTAPPILAVLLSLSISYGDETVEMTTGPKVGVTYENAVWRPLSSLRPPEPGTYQSLTWELQPAKEVQITVASHPEPVSEAEHKQRILEAQKLRGDAATLVRERRESVAGRDWFILEFRNPNTRPPRSETHYFLPTEAGYITLFAVVDEANLPKHRDSIQAFLRSIQIK